MYSNCICTVIGCEKESGLAVKYWIIASAIKNKIKIK